MRIRKDNDEILDDEVSLMAQCSDALAHPARIRMFRHIMACNKSLARVCNKDLVGTFDYSQATISQHIKKLITSGLVNAKREDRYTYYYANIGTLMKYLDVTKKFE
ncbi:MAG: helix-turn-helix domain-containing protein [Eubacteriaceae bacterium]|nr:helix-turn-helix domain-containing protein [Eubacteriaceae bacterium]